MKTIISIIVLIVIIVLGFMFFYMRGPDISQFQHLKDPRIVNMPDQKMVEVKATGDPNIVGGKAFGLLFNVYYKHIQTESAVLRNFGVLGQARYILQSLGPELRQYWFSDDTSEKPFNRTEREEVYRKARGIDSTSAFGSQDRFDHTVSAVGRDRVVVRAAQ